MGKKVVLLLLIFTYILTGCSKKPAEPAGSTPSTSTEVTPAVTMHRGGDDTESLNTANIFLNCDLTHASSFSGFRTFSRSNSDILRK